MQITGRHYQTGELVRCEIAGGKVARVTRIRLSGAGSSAKGQPWIAPGFVDLQINGHGGQEFSSLELTPEMVAQAAVAQAASGVTRFCPTVTTAGRETISHSLRTIAATCRSRPIARRIAGIHLEGPYLSREDGPRGAHPREHCRAPDWDEFQHFQETAGGLIRLLTMSPEYENSAPFIARAVRSGVVVSLGHTAANSDQIRAAVDAGARASTHLGNGCHAQLRRHPNYLWDQLAEDRLSATLIADGFHLPPEVVKIFVRAKSPERCILVSDLSQLAGLAPGKYGTSLCEVELLADGRLVIAGQDQLQAGASLSIGAGVVNVMDFAGVDLAAAVHMASRQPAALIGSPPGGLSPGDVADLVLFEIAKPTRGRPAKLRTNATIIAGEVEYGTLASRV